MEAATGELSFSILFTFNKLECEKRTVKYVSVRLCCFVELLCSFPIAAMINHQKLCSLKIIPMFSLAVLEIRSLMWVSAGYHQDVRRAVFLPGGSRGGPPGLLSQLPEATHILGSISLCLQRRQCGILLTILPLS